jgi:surface protein
MNQMFGLSLFNQPIGSWDVSSVTDMRVMFSKSPFNQPIGNWDVRNVTDMGYLFSNSPFNQPINRWCVTNIKSEPVEFSFNSPLLPQNKPIWGTCPKPTSIDTDEQPTQFSLYQNYPNPFNPTTQIRFTIPQTTQVQLEVYSILGQKVSTLINGTMNSGTHTVSFDGKNLTSGVYIYRLTTPESTQSKVMNLVK